MFSKLRSTLEVLRTDRRGVTALEYGLLAAVMGVLIVAGATTLGGAISAAFTAVAALL